MNTSDILYEAANLIEFEGWAGRGGGWSWDDAEGLCLEGAIEVAAGVDVIALPACPAYRAMVDYLGDEAVTLRIPSADYVSSPRLYHYNDAPDRTAAEVIEVLRAAAVIEAAKEQAAVDELGANGVTAKAVAPVGSVS